MLTYLQAIILGGVQGITELFPVSSLGHSVILPKLLGWAIDQQNPYFLIFLVATHFATALVLLAFFSKDWLLIAKGVLRSFKKRRIDSTDTYARLGWLIIVATIPVGILGLLFQEKLTVLFASATAAASFLVLNGCLFLAVEHWEKKQIKERLSAQASQTSDQTSDQTIAKLSWGQTVKVGFMQVLALLPGFSRTGATLSGGLLVGLDHEDAARFSFLLATPVILAAALLDLPDLFTGSRSAVGPILAGAAIAAVCSYFSVRFLTQYFKTKTLTVFGFYCILAGLGSLTVFFLR